MYTALTLSDFKLSVYLGWPDEERANKQTVTITIQIAFAEKPNALSSDDLADTVCYDKLCQHLSAQVESQTFKLIEHLAHCLYQETKSFVADSKVAISVSKNPPIENVSKACFSISDWEI